VEELLNGLAFPSLQVHRAEHPVFARGDSDNSTTCFLTLLPPEKTVSEIEYSIRVPCFSDVELTPFVIQWELKSWLGAVMQFLVLVDMLSVGNWSKGTVFCGLLPYLSGLRFFFSITWDSAVGIATGYGAGRPRGRSSSHGRGKKFNFSVSTIPVLGLTQPPLQWVPGARRLGREADHSTPTSVEIKKTGLYIHSPTRLHGLISKNRGNFTIRFPWRPFFKNNHFNVLIAVVASK
jgi:hypothetical protein